MNHSPMTHMNMIKPSLMEYGLAVTVTLLALLARFILDPFLGDHLPYVTFFVSVAVVSYYGGLGASLTAVALGALTTNWFFVSPRHSLAVMGLTHQVGYAAFILVSLTFVGFGHVLRRARQRANEVMDGLRREVIERKKGEEALRESEHQLRLLIQHAPAAIAMFDRQMRYLAVSRRWLEDYRVKESDVVGRSHYDIFPEVSDRWKEFHRRGLQGETLGEEADRFERVDGSVQWLHWQIHPWRAEDGDVGGIIIFAEEITGRKQAEDALLESEERFRTLADNISQFTWMADAAGWIFWYNRRWYEYTGTTFDEMQGWGWETVHHPDHVDRVVKKWRQAHATGEPWEDTFPLRGKDGVYRWFLSRAMPIRDAEGKVLRWFGTNTDVTEQRETEAALRGSDNRFRAAVEAVSSLIWTNNAQGRMEGEQQGWGNFTGQTYEEYQGYGWSNAVHPEDAQPTIDAWNEAVAQKRNFIFEHRVRRYDGEWRLFSIRAVPVMTGEGAIREWVGVHTDITERKLTEQALRESGERLKSFAGQLEQLVGERTEELTQAKNRLALAVRAGHAGTFDWNTKTNITVWSDELLELYGLKPEEFGGRYEDWIACLLPADHEVVADAITRSLEEGEFVADFRILRQDNGEVRWMHGRGQVFFDDAGQPVRMVGINMDITDRKRAEEAYDRAEKFTEELERKVMERTQELVGSQERLRALATELNLAEQRERKRLAGELHDYLAQLLVLCRLNLGQAKRAGLPPKAVEIVRDTEEVLGEALNYSRTLMAELSPMVLQEHGLPAGLKWLGEQMQRRNLMVTVDVGDVAELSLPEDCAVLLFQSVRELLMNALKHAASNEVAVRLSQSNGRLRIEVRDEGTGFDLAAASVADKPTALSSKFGLFSIRERMKALGGWFELQSAPGQGTTAVLVLPLLGAGVAQSRVNGQRSWAGDESIVSHQPTVIDAEYDDASSRIRVLLVDDHAMVRQGLRSVLDSYADVEVVGESWNGEEAVASVERLQPAIVVMDINMPKMNGIEATAKIKFCYPNIIVIGLSVQAGGANEEAMKNAGAAILLTKEAAVDELYRAIQEARRMAQQA